MKINVTTRSEVTILAPAGELNHDSAPRFEEAVDQVFDQGRRDFVVDLQQLTSVDSAGLEALTALQRRCEDQLGMVHFCGADATLRKVFELTRLDRRLGLHEDLEEALATFG